MIGHVLHTERDTEEDVHVTNVVVDTGGGSNVTAELLEASGEDAPPLPGDAAVLVEVDGAGSEAVVGFNDPKNEKTALPGERRTFARDLAGNVVAEIWAKRNGDISITSLASGGKITLNGVTIDQNGNITAPGEVTAKSTSTPVKLSTHLHPTAMGPSGKPTPGT